MHGASSPIRSKPMTMLADKTALVTGASRGMGRATALALGAAGARVIVHYGRNADEAKAVVDQIRAHGGKAQRVAAKPKPSPPTLPRRTARTCSPQRCAIALAAGSTFWCATPAFPAPTRSR